VVTGQIHTPATLILVKEPPSICWVCGWVGSRASLDVLMKRFVFCPCQESSHNSSNLPCSVDEFTADPQTAVTLFLHQYPYYDVFKIHCTFIYLLRMVQEVPTEILIFCAVLSFSDGNHSVNAPLSTPHCPRSAMLQAVLSSHCLCLPSLNL
jgi:hypothetical protein